MSTSQTAHQPEISPIADEEVPTCEQLNSTELLDILSDEYVRDLLDCLGESSRAASDLADQIDASRATVYRRLNRLTNAGVVESSVSIDPNGHHRKEFRVVAETAIITFGDTGVTAGVKA